MKDSGLAEMSEDFISHDVMINAYAEHISGKAREDFERFSDESRRDYYGYDPETFNEWKTGKTYWGRIPLLTQNHTEDII